VQLTPFGVQMPQLGLQHEVPGRQIAPPHDSTLVGLSASVLGAGSLRGTAGAGHSGQNRAQICLPVQSRHTRFGGWHDGVAATGSALSSGAACGAHSGQRTAQNSPPLQPTH
jgi:hypothetical protein